VVVAPKSVPLHIAVSRRALGYLKTDPNTPIVTDWCKAMLKHYGEHTTTKYDHLIELPYQTGYPVDLTRDLTDVVSVLVGDHTFVDRVLYIFKTFQVPDYPPLVELIIPPGVVVDGVKGPSKIEAHGNRRARPRPKSKAKTSPTFQKE